MQLKKLAYIFSFFFITINAYAGVTFYDFWIKTPTTYIKGENNNFDAQFKVRNNGNSPITITDVEITILNSNGTYNHGCWYRSINKKLYKNDTYHATKGYCTLNQIGNYKVVAKVKYGGSYYDSPKKYSISVVNPPIPPRPSLYSPSGNITDITPTIKWSTVSKATKYKFYLYDSTSRQFIYKAKSVYTTNFTSKILKVGHTYNWWVTSCNSSGCSSQGSSYKTFKVINAPINGQCGTANGKNYSASTTSYGSDTQCSVGNSDDTRLPEQGSIIYWSCSGLYGGDSANCEASRKSVSLPNVKNKGVTPNPVKSGESIEVYCNFYDNLPSGYKVKVGVDSSTTIYPLKGSKNTYKNLSAPSSTGTHTIYYKLYNGTAYVKDLGYSSFTVNPSPLNPPSGVSASDNTYEDKIRVTWNSVSGATKYKIYRSQYPTSNYEYIDETSNTYYNDSTVVAGYTYYYKIKAYNSSSGLSDYSNYDSGKRKEVILSPTITSVSPLIATQNVATNYTITGTNLTSSIIGNIEGSSTHCSYISGTNTSVVLSCKAEVIGNKRFYLKDKSGGTTISGLENIYITVKAPQSVLPSSVDAPVNGTNWRYRQHTQDNATYYGGIGTNGNYANDNYAWDLNWGSNSNDDEGLPVYAIESGTVETFNGWGGKSYGQLLIRHGTDGNYWYSGYLHMKNITTKTYIQKGDKIGEISKTGYLKNLNITAPHLHFAVYKMVDGKLLSQNITINKNKEWVQPKENTAPKHISTIITPKNISNAKPFTITSRWKDEDGDYIVDVKARYRAKNNGSFTEVILTHNGATRDGEEFSKTITNGLVAGDYELEVQASDKKLLNGKVLHNTGWIKVDDFKVYGNYDVKLKFISDSDTLSDTRSLKLTNKIKIQVDVKNAKSIAIDYDNDGVIDETKTITKNGIKTFEHQFIKTNYGESDYEEYWAKDLKWKIIAYNKYDDSSLSYLSEKFTIYDYDSWLYSKQPIIQSSNPTTLKAQNNIQTLYLIGENFTPKSIVEVDYGNGYEKLDKHTVNYISSKKLALYLKTTVKASGKWKFKVKNNNKQSNIFSVDIDEDIESKITKKENELKKLDNDFETIITSNINVINNLIANDSRLNNYKDSVQIYNISHNEQIANAYLKIEYADSYIFTKNAYPAKVTLEYIKIYDFKNGSNSIFPEQTSPIIVKNRAYLDAVITQSILYMENSSILDKVCSTTSQTLNGGVCVFNKLDKIINKDSVKPIADAIESNNDIYNSKKLSNEEIAIITAKGTKKAVKEILNEYKNTPEDLTNAIQGLFYFTANLITNPSDTIDDGIKKLEKAEDTVKMLALEKGEIAKNIPQLIEGMSQKDKIYYTAYITTHLAHEFAPTSKLKLLKLTKLDKFKRPLWLSKSKLLKLANEQGYPMKLSVIKYFSKEDWEVFGKIYTRLHENGKTALIKEERTLLRLISENNKIEFNSYLVRMLKGMRFNKLRTEHFDANEVYIDTGKYMLNGKGAKVKKYFRLDSYNYNRKRKPLGIFSRKDTQLSKVTVQTAKGYIKELKEKYPAGATIANVPSSNQYKPPLGGKKLDGQLYLEVPPQKKDIPQEVLDYAKSLKIKIRVLKDEEYK